MNDFQIVVSVASIALVFAVGALSLVLIFYSREKSLYRKVKFLEEKVKDFSDLCMKTAKNQVATKDYVEVLAQKLL